MGHINHSGNGSDCGVPVLQHRKPRLIHCPLIAIPQTSDEFEAGKLGLQWQWHANHQEDWYSLSARKGWLRLYPQFTAHEHPAQSPNLLLQKFPARSFTAETLIEFAPLKAGEEAGLIVTGESFATLALEKMAAGNQLVLRLNGVPKFVQENLPLTAKLRVAVKDGGICTFSFATSHDWVTIPQIFPARKGVWIGAKFGLYSVKRLKSTPAGHVDIDYFRFM